MNLEDLKSFRAPEHVKIISELLAQVVHDPLNIMQVCGTIPGTIINMVSPT